MFKEGQTRLSDLDLPFYFRSLIALARGDDGMIDEEELAYLRAQAALHDCDVQAYLEEPVDALPFPSQPTSGVSRETAASVIRDAITLCYINGTMSAGQKNVLYRCSRELGIAPEEVDAIEDWLVRLWSLLEEGERLLGAREERKEG